MNRIEQELRNEMAGIEAEVDEDGGLEDEDEEMEMEEEQVVEEIEEGGVEGGKKEDDPGLRAIEEAELTPEELEVLRQWESDGGLQKLEEA
jgi:hypothetical protein